MLGKNHTRTTKKNLQTSLTSLTQAYTSGSRANTAWPLVKPTLSFQLPRNCKAEPTYPHKNAYRKTKHTQTHTQKHEQEQAKDNYLETKKKLLNPTNSTTPGRKTALLTATAT